MKRLLLTASFLAGLLLFGHPALAAGERCEYDLQCGQGETCWDAVCTPDDEIPVYVGADEQCGRDRRCRIERLKRRNQARRQLDVLREEEIVRQELERLRARELDERPREKHPWNVGWNFTIQSPAGFTGGYTFAHPFRVEAAFLNIDQSYFSSGADGGSINGDVDASFFDLGIVLNVLSGTTSPYLKAGAMFGTGSFASFDGFFSGGGSTDIVFHALEFEGGFDFAFDFGDTAGGLHLRLGAAFRPLIFNQARISPGVYDATTRDGMANWWDETMFVDLNFIIGWVF